MPHRKSKRPRGVHHTPGHIYVLRSPRDLLLKVGGTSRLGKRLAGLRVDYGRDAHYVALWPVPDVAIAERQAHESCTRWRIHDERYRLAVDWLGEYLVVQAVERALTTFF